MFTTTLIVGSLISTVTIQLKRAKVNVSGLQLVRIIEGPDKRGPDNRGCTVCIDHLAPQKLAIHSVNLMYWRHLSSIYTLIRPIMLQYTNFTMKAQSLY